MKQFSDILNNNILAYWMNRLQDREEGGFYGRVDGKNHLYPQASKGGILNARILWTFSAAYRITKNPAYLTMAERAFEYLKNYFIDKEFGGIYWELDYTGKPVQTKKQLYVQGFALYGFSEFYRATGHEEALVLSKDFFHLIESHRDTVAGGYPEAFTREWKPIEDMRLSEKDANERKSMNTHLHILEPYTNLYRIWPDEQVKMALHNLIHLFTERILNPDTYHLNLFFDDNWQVKSHIVSYGHDIEAAWLLYEAAEVTGDNGLIKYISPICLHIARAALEGYMPDGSLIYEKEGDHVDADRHWWVQAEAVVGLLYAWKISGKESYREKAMKTWEYILNNLVDNEQGEWYWSRLADGSVNETDDKAGFWKCPYHNGRMCMEVIEHFLMNKDIK